MRFVYNKILLLFVLIGFLAASFISYQRMQVEKVNKTVDLTIDYEALLRLAEASGVSREEVLQRAKEVGFTSLAVYETTFKKFNENGKVSSVLGADLIKNYNAGGVSDRNWNNFIENENIIGTDIYIVGKNPKIFEETKEDLITRLGEDRVISHKIGDEEVLQVKARYEDFVKMNLGLPTDEMEEVNAAGFMVLARPSNYENATEDKVRKAFSRLNNINVSEVVFAGRESLGANDALNATIEEFRERNLTLGLIEGVTQLKFYPQEGMEKIAKEIGYGKVARLYSIPADEMAKIKVNVAVERWANTTKERNIRIDHLRIFEKPEIGKTLLETNFDYFQRTADILREKGFVLGKADTYIAYYPQPYLRVLAITGIIAAALLLLSMLSPWINQRQKALTASFFVLSILFAIPIIMGHGATIRVISAFLAANVFPVLAMTALLDISREFEDKKPSIIKLIIAAAFALVFAGTISMMGAAYLSGALSDVEYFLEFEIYRGIKLTFVLPLILVALIFLSRFSLFDEKTGVIEQLREFLNMTVKVKSLAIVGVILLAGLVMIARSGHTLGMPVSSAELQLRAFLEQSFYARPRSKELFIGHPAFMLAVLAWGRKYSKWIFFALVIAGTIGLGSMVETFAHMRTPFIMSLYRGLGGLVLGGVLGAILMFFAWIAERFYVAFTNKEIE